jgi:hypothetical protein
LAALPPGDLVRNAREIAVRIERSCWGEKNTPGLGSRSSLENPGDFHIEKQR